RVLNLLDLADVYMTFFVPEAVAGRLALGSEARLVLDTVRDHVIPARVSFVASRAQFTPKTAETATERQKLMFRVRAQIPRAVVVAGRLALGSVARLVLDTVPDHVSPARVSFVASQAQFSPKTVETASERQKLMFRVRAQIPPALPERYLEQVKTGVPGVAWLKLDADAPWPPELAVSDQLLKLLADE